MFTRRPPYEVDSSAEDRSKPPIRRGLLQREEWNELWDVLVVCWSPDPLERPTASELEAILRTIFQPPITHSFPSRSSSFLKTDATQAE